MKIKITVLFSAIAAVLAAMEVKATDKDKGSVVVPIPMRSRSRSLQLLRSRSRQSMRSRRSFPMLRQLSDFVQKVRKGKLAKFAVAAGLLIASYTLVNYYFNYYYPENPAEAYYPEDWTEEAIAIWISGNYSTGCPESGCILAPSELERMHRHEWHMQQLPRYLKVIPKWRLIHRQRLLGTHAQQRTGSQWVAAGLSTLALVAISASALILWNLKNRKKTGQKLASFSN